MPAVHNFYIDYVILQPDIETCLMETWMGCCADIWLQISLLQTCSVISTTSIMLTDFTLTISVLLFEWSAIISTVRFNLLWLMYVMTAQIRKDIVMRLWSLYKSALMHCFYYWKWFLCIYLKVINNELYLACSSLLKLTDCKVP